MRLNVLANWVIVKPIVNDKKDQQGQVFIKPDANQNYGEVLGAGSKTGLKAGIKIYYGNKHTKTLMEGDELAVMECENVIAVKEA